MIAEAPIRPLLSNIHIGDTVTLERGHRGAPGYEAHTYTVIEHYGMPTNTECTLYMIRDMVKIFDFTVVEITRS